LELLGVISMSEGPEPPGGTSCIVWSIVWPLRFQV
jgi:hypothetical protein